MVEQVRPGGLNEVPHQYLIPSITLELESESSVETYVYNHVKKAILLF